MKIYTMHGDTQVVIMARSDFDIDNPDTYDDTGNGEWCRRGDVEATMLANLELRKKNAELTKDSLAGRKAVKNAVARIDELILKHEGDTALNATINALTKGDKL